MPLILFSTAPSLPLLLRLRWLLLVSLLLTAFLLSSCTEVPPKRVDRTILLRTQGNELRASLTLKVLEEEGPRRTVGMVLTNSEGIPLRSVRAWVRFDPSLLSLADLMIVEPRWVLFAPGEREVDAEAGLLRLGGAFREPVSDQELLLATFTVLLLREEREGTLTFDDWRPDGEGHTAVLSLEGNILENVLQEPSPLVL
jgi:hypothetical protein